MSNAPGANSDPQSPSQIRRVDAACLRFEAACAAGQRPRIEEYLGATPETERAALFRELLALELIYRRRQGDRPILEEYLARFPGYVVLVQAVFAEEVSKDARGPREPNTPQPSIETGPDQAAAEEADIPERLGRYRITARLGSGGFGVVYRGFDDELQREVAIKVPHARLISSPEDAEAFLKEARVLARMDHTGIVPIHDVGRTDDGTCYLVSKFVPGADLRARLAEDRPAARDAAALVAQVAEALHYAHQHGLVHRDIKPANILLDAAGRPVVTDFGLALHEDEYGTGPNFAGTPAYMSPEQARGEGHRVDARSDIYSLGVVFYEMLTGRRPFRDDSSIDLLEQVLAREPRPPRQLDDRIPKELDRICLKALAKRAVDRYSTAIDLAEDLRYWLAMAADAGSPPASAARHVPPPASTPTPPSSAGLSSPAPVQPARPPDSVATDSGKELLRVIPKGLRSFDAEDADFFLELLPGPRDRDGLPESLRFWKRRIEAADPDRAFSVGLLYGPSGCGKSSLVKAGLLPRLAETVIAVYVEATADKTEGRLLNGLRRQCPALDERWGLVESLTRLRKGQALSRGKKVVLVLDQFEQWLHAHNTDSGAELVQALRQCNGRKVQCLLLVRDDFGMAVTRFLHDLEVPIVEGQNFATVDLFGARHARKVLIGFGRSFGALPDHFEELTPDHERFVAEAVAGLSEDGKVIPVRLALFAEMVKAKPWTPATLKEVGGPRGLGVAFLEETFGERGANPKYRLHQRAVRGILKALLPEPGTNLKGHMRSYQDLLDAAGYARRPQDFDDVLRILDAELRLVTPTDPEGEARGEGPGAREEDVSSALPRPSPLAPRPLSESLASLYYQLTHDYLVPDLREWLTRKQRETRRGRAELRLADRAALWSARREYRQLPTWWEWANIRLYTSRRQWNAGQRQMMGRANRLHLLQLAMLLVVLALGAWGIREVYGAAQAHVLLRSLASAETADVPKILRDFEAYRHWGQPALAARAAEPNLTPKERLHLALALLPSDPEQVPYLTGEMLGAPPGPFFTICDLLKEHRQGLSDQLWSKLADAQTTAEQRIRAVCALAAYDPDNPRWNDVSHAVVAQLLKENPIILGQWVKGLHPVRGMLIPPLAEVFRDAAKTPAERSLAAGLLADYAADRPEVLAELAKDAEASQIGILAAALQRHREQAIALMTAELNRPDGAAQPKQVRAPLAERRRANAAAVLLYLGHRDQVWPLWQQHEGSDPTLRTYLIHRVSPVGVDWRIILGRLAEEKDPSARRALILCLGEFTPEQLPEQERPPLVAQLRETYRHEPDPGIHSAVEWLFGRWGRDEELRAVAKELASKGPVPRRRWYINGHGHTLAVFQGPVRLQMGSPNSEPERNNEGTERLQPIEIPRSFAVATKEVTYGQFEQFLNERNNREYNRTAPGKYGSGLQGPAVAVTWFEAAQFCQWLSEKEGIPEREWCFESIAAIKPGMRLPAGYLTRTGYRLPTEAEWEYACRAQAATSRAFGNAEEMLAQYAWYGPNANFHAQPVGRKKPNDFGLFDMYGNAIEWTLQCARGNELYWFQPILRVGWRDSGQNLAIQDKSRMILRGGGFDLPADSLRSAFLIGDFPDSRNNNTGFRIARTISPVGH